MKSIFNFDNLWRIYETDFLMFKPMVFKESLLYFSIPITNIFEKS